MKPVVHRYILGIVFAVGALSQNVTVTTTFTVDCSTFTPLGGPLGAFCPAKEINRCCAFRCSGPGGQPPACAQSAISGVDCFPCTTIVGPTCSTTGIAQATEGFNLGSCPTDWNPCCAYVCRPNNAPAGVDGSGCYAEAGPDLRCLECSGRPVVTEIPRTNGSYNSTATGLPGPTYVSGASAVSVSGAVLFGILCIMFAL